MPGRPTATVVLYSTLLPRSTSSLRASRRIRIRLRTGWTSSFRAGTQPYELFGRIGRLRRYQTFPSAPTAFATASTSWRRKSGRNWCRTSMRFPLGLGVARATADITVSSPAAGMGTASSRAFAFVPALGPASAPDESASAAPAATRTEAPGARKVVNRGILRNEVGWNRERVARRIPRVEGEADARPGSRRAVDQELAAEQANPLGHPGEPEALVRRGALERRLELEAAAVVLDGDVDAPFALGHLHPDMLRAAVVARVRERLAHDVEDRDPARLGQVGEAAGDLELRLDPALVAERRDLARDARVERLEANARAVVHGVEQAAQRGVERLQARLQVVEAAAHALAVVVLDHRQDLAPHGRELGRERRQLLQ